MHTDGDHTTPVRRFIVTLYWHPDGNAQHPLSIRWICKSWHIRRIECTIVTKRKELLLHTTIGMNLINTVEWKKTHKIIQKLCVFFHLRFLRSSKTDQVIYGARGQDRTYAWGKMEWEVIWGAQEKPLELWSHSVSQSGDRLHECTQHMIIHRAAWFVNFPLGKLYFDKNIIKYCFQMINTHLFVHTGSALKGLTINSTSKSAAFLSVQKHQGCTVSHQIQPARWRLWRLNSGLGFDP